jgi:hypothetical protein
MSDRRDFLARLGVLAAAGTLDAEELRAATNSADSKWDTSWIKAVESARYRVVFNASEIAHGAAMDYAATFLDHFHEVHGTRDSATRPVIVFRRLGVPMAFNDAIWDRFAIGEDQKLNDPATKAPARRNIFLSAYPGISAQEAAISLGTLRSRGLISLVCDFALSNWSRSVAERLQLDKNEVANQVRANLIPGAILVPSGIYALIRAQNAGCAWMPGT